MLPAPVTPKVKFAHDKDRPKAPMQGLRNIPDDALRSLAQRLPMDEDWAESEIAQYLTDEYGGDLLPNALRIYKLLGEPGPSSYAPTQKVMGEPSMHPSGLVKNEPSSVERVTTYDYRPPADTPGPPKRDAATTPLSVLGTRTTTVQVPLPVYAPPAITVPHAQYAPTPVLPGLAPALTPSNVISGVAPPGLHAGVAASYGVSGALPPIPDMSDPNKIFPSVAFNMDRLANPDTLTKPGTF